MPENNFNKVSTLWACQTYMENMSKVLKPGEILFGVLFFSTNTASVTDVFEIIAQNMVHKFVPNPMELANFLRHLCEGYIDDAGVIAMQTYVSARKVCLIKTLTDVMDSVKDE